MTFYGIISRKADGSRRWVLRSFEKEPVLYDSLEAAQNHVRLAHFRDLYVCQYQDHNAHMGAVPGEILERRLTHRYVGTYKHEDKHEYVGRLLIEATKVLDTNDDPEDMCEPCTTVLFVRVSSGYDEETVENALRDHFTAWGCAHEYDCCGCRSYRAGQITRLGSGYWRVVQHSSRNY